MTARSVLSRAWQLAAPALLSVSFTSTVSAAPAAHTGRAHSFVANATTPASGGVRSARASLPDGVGGAFVAWNDDRYGDHEVFVQRVDASGQTQWSTDGLRITHMSGDQTGPVLASDGAGGVIVAWTDGRDAANPRIYVQRLDAAGTVLWISDGWPVTYSSTANEFAPVIGSDGAGGAVVGWQDYRSGVTKAYVQRVNANGSPLWGADGMPLCSATGTQVIFGITDLDLGGMVVVWQDDRIGQNRVYAQRLSLAGSPRWTTDGVSVTSLGLLQQQPAVVSDGNGGAVVAYFHTNTTDIRAQRLDSLGVALWGSPGVLVCSAPNAQQNLQLIPDGSGGGVMVWNDNRTNAPSLFAQRVDGTGTARWVANGVGFSDSANGGAVLMPDGTGGAVLAWGDHGTRGIRMRAQRVDGSGAIRWDAGGELIAEGRQTRYPLDIVTDGSGGAILTWRDWRSGDPDIYGQRVDTTGVVHWTTGGVPLALVPGGQRFPIMAADGAGGVIVTWQQKIDGHYVARAKRFAADRTVVWPATPITTDVDQPERFVTAPDGSGGALVAWIDSPLGTDVLYAQRMSAGGVPLWGSQGVKVCDTYESKYDLFVVGDGAGGAYLVWSMSPPIGGAGQVWAQRLDAAGAPRWLDFGILPSPGPSYQSPVAAVSDGAGGAIVAWRDERNGSPQILAQRVDAAGTVWWTADGVAAIEPAINVLRLKGSSDGGGGIVLTWTGYDADTTIVLAQRVDHAGVRRWGADGVRLSYTTDYVDDPAIAATADTGAVVSWFVQSMSSYDIRAQRVGPSGTPQWAKDGVTVCSMSSGLWGPMVVSDAAGGFIFAWDDQRHAWDESYVQRLDGTGAAQWTVNGIPAASGSAQRIPAALVADAGGGAFIAWWGYPADRGEDWLTHLTSGGVPAVGWPGGGTTPTLVSLVGAHAEPDRVRIAWLVTGAAGAVSVERREVSSEWAALASGVADGSGRVSYEDDAVRPGRRYGYRLVIPIDGVARPLGETWVDVPALAVFALDGPAPNPAVSDIVVAFVLPDARSATLELWDVSGRRVLAREVGALGPGRHTLRLGVTRDLAPGVYWLRLARGSESRMAKLVVVR